MSFGGHIGREFFKAWEISNSLKINNFNEKTNKTNDKFCNFYASNFA